MNEQNPIPDILEALERLLVETDQHAEGNCPKLKAACETARTIIKESHNQEE